MYSSYEDKEIEIKEAEVQRKNKLLIQQANSLSWFERNFTNKYEILTDELRDNWFKFSLWQNAHMRKKSLSPNNT